MWEFRYDFDAVRSIYALPRGVAGETTFAIQALALDPTPDSAEPIAERDHMYRLTVGQVVVDYEVVEQDRIIKILFIG